jgi:hypothetical protein
VETLCLHFVHYSPVSLSRPLWSTFRCVRLEFSDVPVFASLLPVIFLCKHYYCTSVLVYIVSQWSDYLLAEPPNTVRSCSRHGVVAAWLTSKRPGSVIPFSKTLLCWQYIHSFSHCGRFWNLSKTLSGAYAVRFLLPACRLVAEPTNGTQIVVTNSRTKNLWLQASTFGVKSKVWQERYILPPLAVASHTTRRRRQGTSTF